MAARVNCVPITTQFLLRDGQLRVDTACMPIASPSSTASISPGEALERALDGLSTLPAFDGSVTKVLALIDEPESATAAIADVIERDEGLAVNVLAAANSAHRSLRIPARTPRQAILAVGRDELRRLVLDAATYRFLDAAPGAASARGALRLHAVEVARYARDIAEEMGVPGDLAYLAGLLHDLGKVVMPMAFDPKAVTEVAAATHHGRELSRAERQRFGVDHSEAAARLIGRWNLDADVTQAVALHHGGPTLFACPTALVACVQLADIVSRVAGGHTMSDPLADVALRRLGSWPAVIEELLERVPEPDAQTSTFTARMQELERQASTDDLTGIANRRHWHETVSARLADGAGGVVLLCDLDEFKALNDRHGHPAGDAALALAAQVLGTHGFVGRLGGDEFAVFVEVDDATAGLAAATRILDSLPLITNEAAFGMSIGVSTLVRSDARLQDVVAEADAALYRAKGAGRNRAAAS
jgi:diguanylate cyclase (GGDEF)-like protein/putative nucleotidyltransferase with HDIG domain